MDPGPMFSPGEKVVIQAADCTLVFTVDRPYVLFTQMVVLIARSPQLGPQPILVKIYDPRFLNERLPFPPYLPLRPWSMEAERAGAALEEDRFEEEWEARYNPEPTDAEGLAMHAAVWEKHYQRLSSSAFRMEHTAYERLAHLQGSAIPLLLLIGTYLPPDERVIHLPAIVFEFIPDAVEACDVNPTALDPEVCTMLLRAIDSFPSCGVFHADLRYDHILFTPRNRPTRGVIIDFGAAGIKEDDDKESWQVDVEFYNDSGFVRKLLRVKGVLVEGVEICEDSSSSKDSSVDSKWCVVA